MFRWDCSGCGGWIADHGPAKGPALDQDGHKPGCVRLAAEAARTISREEAYNRRQVAADYGEWSDA